MKANMAKAKYYLIVDTETSITDKVADFGAVIVNSKGEIKTQCAILVDSVFGVDSLFYDLNASGLWAKASVERRTLAYQTQLQQGTRMLASVAAINRWLEKAKATYNPELTAYNLAFDMDKMRKTGIDADMFADRFCLWAASVGNICNTKAYKQFVIENHLFNAPTDKGNMTYSTTAESVTGFLSGSMTDEPHTAIEDVIGWELPTLLHIIKKRKWREKMVAYSWNAHQVKDHFTAK